MESTMPEAIITLWNFIAGHKQCSVAAVIIGTFLFCIYMMYTQPKPPEPHQNIVFYSNVFASNVECLYGLKFKADNGFSGIGDSRKVFQSHGTLTVYDSLNHPIVSLHVFCTIDMEKKIGSIMDDRSSMLPDITDKKSRILCIGCERGKSISTSFNSIPPNSSPVANGDYPPTMDTPDLSKSYRDGIINFQLSNFLTMP